MGPNGERDAGAGDGPNTGPHPALILLRMLALDLGAPIALYYALKSAGVGDLPALLAGSVPPTLSTAVGFVRERRVDRLGMFVLTMMALSAVVSEISGNPRLLLLRDGWLTGAGGVCFLATVPGRNPLAYTFSRPLLERQFRPDSGPWDTLWDIDPQFRRIWRVCTLMWGVGLLADSAVRTLMAATLPVHVVPALNGVQYGVFTLLMLVITNLYQARARLWWILAGRPADPPPT